MSATVSFPLRYVLPATALTLGATLRLEVVVDELGGHLEPELSVSLSAPWHPAPLSSVRRVLDARPDAGILPPFAAPGSLRRAFDRTHPRAAALICDLSARSEQYLAGLRMGEEAGQVVTFGQALEVVHRELAAADRTRREWISRQGRDLRASEWDLSSQDMVNVAGTPGSLPGDLAVPTARAREVARDYGLLVAICAEELEVGRHSLADSARVAVYRRTPDELPDHPAADPAREWVRDDALSRLQLAEAGDTAAEIPQQRQAEHGDRFPAPVVGGQLITEPALEAAARAARTQLQLLDVSDEYSRLAATQFRTDEIAALQHEMRLTYLPRQHRGGW